MATHEHSAATALPKPTKPTFIAPYGGGLNLDRAVFAALLDDLLQDLADIRQHSTEPSVHQKLDDCLQTLAATAGVASQSDLSSFPNWPGDAVIYSDRTGDGFDDLRWLTAVVQRGSAH